MRDSIVFYKSFYEAVEKIKDPAIKLEVLEAIMIYAFFDKTPKFESPVSDAMWTLIKPQIDANNIRYENGKKGGAPKGSRNNPNGRRGNKPITNQELTENKPNVNVNVNENDNVNVNVNGSVPDKTTHRFLTFGRLNNVMLTDEQRQDLKESYQNSNKLIDKVSVWLPNAKTEQNDHFALCIKFAENDDWPKKPKPDPKPEPVHEADLLTEEERLANLERLKNTVKGIF